MSDATTRQEENERSGSSRVVAVPRGVQLTGAVASSAAGSCQAPARAPRVRPVRPSFQGVLQSKLPGRGGLCAQRTLRARLGFSIQP